MPRRMGECVHVKREFCGISGREKLFWSRTSHLFNVHLFAPYICVPVFVNASGRATISVVFVTLAIVSVIYVVMVRNVVVCVDVGVEHGGRWWAKMHGFRLGQVDEWCALLLLLLTLE